MGVFIFYLSGFTLGACYNTSCTGKTYKVGSATQDYAAGLVIRTDAQCAASGCTKGAASCGNSCDFGHCINLPGCQATCSNACVWGCSGCTGNVNSKYSQCGGQTTWCAAGCGSGTNGACSASCGYDGGACTGGCGDYIFLNMLGHNL